MNGSANFRTGSVEVVQSPGTWRTPCCRRSYALIVTMLTFGRGLRLDAFREVRDEYISLDKPPASTLVQVSGLVNPAFRVEIDALAAI